MARGQLASSDVTIDAKCQPSGTAAAAITSYVWRSALQRCTHGTLGGSESHPSAVLPCLHAPTWTLMLSASHAVLSLHNQTHCSRPGMRLFREHAVTRHHRARTRLPVRRPGGWGGGVGVGGWGATASMCHVQETQVCPSAAGRLGASCSNACTCHAAALFFFCLEAGGSATSHQDGGREAIQATRPTLCTTGSQTPVRTLQAGSTTSLTCHCFWYMQFHRVDVQVEEGCM